MAQAVRTGVFTPDDRAAAVYQPVRIEVPTGCAGLAVELAYDRSAGVLDLGCEGPCGFRGWSGGARSRFAITADAATPGYLPGELAAGPWTVWLGLHRVPAAGVGWQLTVRTGPVEPDAEPVPPAPPPERPPRRVLPAEPGRRWLAGDLHAHTVHSDGALGVAELACRAAGRGLDFLAVTDHNTVSHHRGLAAAAAYAGLALLPGQEVTTDRGHANAFGDIGWVDFREPPAAWVATVARRGGLLSVNHPLSGDCAWRWPLRAHPPLAEVWHSSWLDRTWGAPFAWWEAWDAGAAEPCGATVGVGGSDFHRAGDGIELGRPTTWVHADGTGTDAILSALRAGRVAVTADPAGPALLRVGDRLVALGAGGLVLTEPSGRRRVVHDDRAGWPAEPGPHWLEDDRNAVQAICC